MRLFLKRERENVRERHPLALTLLSVHLPLQLLSAQSREGFSGLHLPHVKGAVSSSSEGKVLLDMQADSLFTLVNSDCVTSYSSQMNGK